MRGWSSCDVSARFELLHACQLKKLTPILMSVQLPSPSDATSQCKSSEALQVRGKPKHRAPLLIDSLVVEARRRGVTVEAKLCVAACSLMRMRFLTHI